MSDNVSQALGVIVGIAFIVIGVVLLAYPVSFSPLPQWANSMIFIFPGVGFFSYGVTGRSRMLERIRRCLD